MSDVGPVFTSPVDWQPTDPTAAFYGAPTPTTPVVPIHSANVKTLAGKYRSPFAYGPTFGREVARSNARNPNAVTALRRLDTAKVLRGGKPYTADESAVGLRAATDNQFVTTPPDQPFWSNLTDDVKALVSGVPKLPALLYKEGQDLGDLITGNYDSGLPAATNPLEAIGSIANLPIARLVPGSFIAGSFARDQGGIDNLIKHPLFTALDILPAASTGAKSTKTVQLAEKLKVPLAEHLAAGINYYHPQPNRPIRTLIRNWHPSGPQTRVARDPMSGQLLDDVVDEAALLNYRNTNPGPFNDPQVLAAAAGRTTLYELAPNKLGQAMDSMAQKIRRGRLGQLRADAFSPRARFGAQLHQEVTYDRVQKPIIEIQEGRAPIDVGAEGAVVRVAQAAEDAGTTGDQARRMYDIARDAESAADARNLVESEMGTPAAVYFDELMASQQQILDAKLASGDLVPVEFQFPDPANPGATLTRVEHLLPDAATKVHRARLNAAVNSQLAGFRTALDDVWQLDDVAAQARADKLLSDLPMLMAGHLPDLSTTGLPMSLASAFRTNKAQRLAIARSTIAELSALGYDTTPLVDAFKGKGQWALTKGKPLNSVGMLEAWANKFFSHPTTGFSSVPLSRSNHLGAIDSVIADLARTSDPKAAILRQQLKAGDISGAYATVRALKSRAKFTYPIDWDALIADLNAWERVMKASGKFDQMNVTGKAKTSATAVTDAEKLSMPGRYAEHMRAQADAKFLDDVLNGELTVRDPQTGKMKVTLTPEQQARVQDIMAREAIGELDDIDLAASTPDGTLSPDLRSGLVDTYNAYLQDARKSWQNYVARTGADPIYIHRISIRDARKAFNPKFVDKIPGMVSLRNKLTNAERFPAVRNLAISITHDAYEMILRGAAQEFIERLTTVYGRSMPDVLREFAPEARRRSLASGRPYNEVLQDLVQSEYVEWKPNAYTTGRSELPVAYTHDKLMIPREVKFNIDRMISDPGIFDRLMGKPMTIFRTAVLPLSPRWHLNNIVGGFISLGATLGPEGMLAGMKHIGEAWRRANKREGAARIPGAPAEGVWAAQGRWGVETAHGLMKAPAGERVAVMQQLYAGKAAGKLLDSVVNVLGDRGISWIEAVGDKASGAVRYSYKINAMFDDFYRQFAFLSGESSALKKGMTAAQAQRQGVALSRKILQDWDRMTPIERSIIRNVFPFYSWAAHTIKFVSRYPADHPWRLSITARLAETEWNDHLSGIPIQLRDLLFFGDVKDGRVTGINMGGFNPFRDVANYPALVGFLMGQEGGNLDAIGGQLNPYIQLGIRGLGVDPVFGPDLYPNLEYDPQTGGVRVNQPSNFPTSIAAAFVPQSRLLSDLLGWNQDFRELAASNPDAASRRLQSSLGLPILSRTMDMDAEQIRNEINRFRQMNDEKAVALKSGDIDSLRRWPGLRAMAQKVDAMAAEQRKKMTPNQRHVSLLDLLGAAAPYATTAEADHAR